MRSRNTRTLSVVAMTAGVLVAGIGTSAAQAAEPHAPAGDAAPAQTVPAPPEVQESALDDVLAALRNLIPGLLDVGPQEPAALGTPPQLPLPDPPVTPTAPVPAPPVPAVPAVPQVPDAPALPPATGTPALPALPTVLPVPPEAPLPVEPAPTTAPLGAAGAVDVPDPADEPYSQVPAEPTELDATAQQGE